MKLTPSMREALTTTLKGALRRTHTPGPGKPPWPAAATTLHALVRHGFLVRSELRNRHGVPYTQWDITDAGRDALQPKVKPIPDVDEYLDRNGWITRNPARSIDREQRDGKDMAVPRQKPEQLSDRWTEDSKGRHLRATNGAARKQEAKSLARRIQRALAAGDSEELARLRDELDRVRDLLADAA